MPIIRPSSDLRNSYNEISNICHETNKPIYITKNGAGDLAVMSIELYEMLAERYENNNKPEISIESTKKIEVKDTKATNIKEEEKKNSEVKNNVAEETINAKNQDSDAYNETVDLKPESSNTLKEDKPIKLDNNYTNKDNKTIKDSNAKRENMNTNNEKHHPIDKVFRKIDTITEQEPKAEPESAHEILQTIEPIVQTTQKETKNDENDIFRSIDTEITPTEKKQANTVNTKSFEVKDTNNTDWIFEDLNKMLNDIKV